jgi:hypothetical protein
MKLTVSAEVDRNRAENVCGMWRVQHRSNRERRQKVIFVVRRRELERRHCDRNWQKASHLSRNDGVHYGTTVTYHEDEFGVREQLPKIDGGSQSERIFVTETRSSSSVFGDDFQDERADRRVEHGLIDAGFSKPTTFERSRHPLLTHAQNARNHTSLFATTV